MVLSSDGTWRHTPRWKRKWIRDIYDATGQVVGSSRYDPFGNVMSQGGATSVFAFAGEQRDATGLEYLRARYYSAAQGRFTTRDVWEGDPNAPMSYNAWLYAYADAVNVTDPSGQVPAIPPSRCGCGSGMGGCEQLKGTALYEPCKFIVSFFESLSGAGQGSTPTPGPTLPPTSTPTVPPTGTPTQAPVLTAWERGYGHRIAAAALDILARKDQYYVWGAHEGEDFTDPPPRQPPKKGLIWWNKDKPIDVYERVGTKTPVVCADVVALAYEGGGLNLKSFSRWKQQYEYDATRNVKALNNLVTYYGKIYDWPNAEGWLPKLGDIVMTGDLVHSSVVAEKRANDANQIFLVEASYGIGQIDKESLSHWLERWKNESHFGHPDPNRR